MWAPAPAAGAGAASPPAPHAAPALLRRARVRLRAAARLAGSQPGCPRAAPGLAPAASSRLSGAHTRTVRARGTRRGAPTRRPGPALPHVRGTHSRRVCGLLTRFPPQTLLAARLRASSLHGARLRPLAPRAPPGLTRRRCRAQGTPTTTLSCFKPSSACTHPR
jgi:hypothetical protein